MKRLTFLALVVVVVLSPTPRAAPEPPKNYLVDFACPDLPDLQRESILHDVEPMLVEQIPGVPMEARATLSDADRNRMTQEGTEVVDIKLERTGDDWNLRIDLVARVHPGKTYSAMTMKTKIPAERMMRLPTTLGKIATIVGHHYKLCHVEGVCS